MVLRQSILAVLVTCGLSLGTEAALAQVTNTYDFSSQSGTSLTAPVSITGSDGATVATFSSAASSYNFGPNAGLFVTLGATVLSDGGTSTTSGTVATPLDIAFSQAQSSVSFDFSLNDLLGAAGGDTISVTTNTGATFTATAVVPTGGFDPEGSFTLSSATPLSSLVITPPTALTLTIADLTSTSPAPEPESVALMLAGLAGVFVAARRRRA